MAWTITGSSVSMPRTPTSSRSPSKAGPDAHREVVIQMPPARWGCGPRGACRRLRCRAFEPSARCARDDKVPCRATLVKIPCQTGGIGRAPATANRPQQARKRLWKANSNPSPRYVRTPSTAGNTRENPRKCRRPAVGCSRHAGPQRGRSGGSCGPFGCPIRFPILDRGIGSA
jgi:hypothetical protein